MCIALLECSNILKRNIIIAKSRKDPTHLSLVYARIGSN